VELTEDMLKKLASGEIGDDELADVAGGKRVWKSIKGFFDDIGKGWRELVMYH